MKNTCRLLSRILAIFMTAIVGSAFFAACDMDRNIQFAISFSANGGTGAAPNPILASAGENVTLPGPNTLTRSGYNFAGWNTSAAGTGTIHNEGAVIPMPNGNITLYAIWVRVAPLITWEAAVYGSPTTTAINFTFSADPGTMQESYFTITPGSGSASAVAVSGTTTMRTLTVTNVTAGNVTVLITKDGVTSAPQTVTLSAADIITWEATAFGTPITTAINFTFSANPGAMQASYFTITPGSGSAEVGDVSGSAATRTLTVTDVSAGDVLVSINRSGVASEPQPVTLYAPEYITWTATAIGNPTTTAISFTFSSDPGDIWNPAIITITPVSGSAFGLAVTGTGTSRMLTLDTNVITAGEVLVSVNLPGVVSEPQPVTIVVGAAPLITWTAAATGTPTTTAIIFTFSSNPAASEWGNIAWGDLSQSNFTILPDTGSATVGTSTGAGTTRTLTINNVGAGYVWISVNRDDIASAPQQVMLVAPVADITWTATPIGSPTTTAINFNFSADPGAMQASDFTITSGTGSATRGALSGSGLMRTLNISEVAPGSVMVSVNRPGVSNVPQGVTLNVNPILITIRITDIPSRYFGGWGDILLRTPGTTIEVAEDEYWVTGTSATFTLTAQPGVYDIVLFVEDNWGGVAYRRLNVPVTAGFQTIPFNTFNWLAYLSENIEPFGHIAPGRSRLLERQ